MTGTRPRHTADPRYDTKRCGPVSARAHSRCALRGAWRALLPVDLLSSVPVLCDELDDLRANLGLAQRDH